ncbi:MAG: hypothetical protein NTV88_04150 [Candidatus Micrarchaeota archaeon]|nr:hypothetical protein [Candidatus Micrarchaeota archaeon]
MGILTGIKSLLCNHVYQFDSVFPTGMRIGALRVNFKCEKCGKTTWTFHDLTETEKPIFRQPHIEQMLFRLGYLTKKKNGEVVFNQKPKKP